MKFFIDDEGIYKFEMQKVSLVKEIKSKAITIPAIEALLRILTYDDCVNKDIVSMSMTYYSLEEDNWQNITKINSDPTWKVIFSDGSQKYLTNLN
jgi:hypothetical protein